MSISSVNAKTNVFERLGAVLVRRKKLALALTLLFVILSVCLYISSCLYIFRLFLCITFHL